METDKRGYYKMYVFKKDAVVGKLVDPFSRLSPRFKIVEVTDETFSACVKDDCLKVWCEFVGNEDYQHDTLDALESGIVDYINVALDVNKEVGNK